jgi:hypothetical protein
VYNTSTKSTKYIKIMSSTIYPAEVDVIPIEQIELGNYDRKHKRCIKFINI